MHVSGKCPVPWMVIENSRGREVSKLKT